MATGLTTKYYINYKNLALALNLLRLHRVGILNEADVYK